MPSHLEVGLPLDTAVHPLVGIRLNVPLRSKTSPSAIFNEGQPTSMNPKYIQLHREHPCLGQARRIFRRAFFDACKCNNTPMNARRKHTPACRTKFLLLCYSSLHPSFFGDLSRLSIFPI